jgi:hypothetical protein
MPVDYSKFEKVEDSDEEKEKDREEKKEEIKKSACPPVKDVECANCAKVCAKQFKCGTCKKATYCSAACQREDWKFHKRNCKAPEVKKKEEEKPKPPPESRKQTGKSEVVRDDDDDVGDWYRHREWRPEKKEHFVPTKVTEPQQIPATGVSAGGASAWNKAGTWEDKDTMAWWKERLPSALESVQYECSLGKARVSSVKEIKGEASICSVRGSLRYLFDLSFETPFVVQRTGEHGEERIKGKITWSEFSDALAKQEEFAATEVSCDTPGYKDQGKKVVEKEVVPALFLALRDLIAEYQKESLVSREVPAIGTGYPVAAG